MHGEGSGFEEVILSSSLPSTVQVIGVSITTWPSMNCKSLKTCQNLIINIAENVVKNVTIDSFSIESIYLFVRQQ